MSRHFDTIDIIQSVESKKVQHLSANIAVLEQNRLQTMIFDSRNENQQKMPAESCHHPDWAPRHVFFNILAQSELLVGARSSKIEMSIFNDAL